MDLWFNVLSNQIHWIDCLIKVTKIIQDWRQRQIKKVAKYKDRKFLGWNYFHLQKLDNFSHVACGCLFLKIRDEDWKFENIRGIFHD